MSAKDPHGNLLMQQLITLEIQSSLTLTVNGTSLKIASPSNVVVMTMTLSDRQAGAFMPPQQGSVTVGFNPQKGQLSALGSISDLNDVLSQLRFSTVTQGNHTAKVELDDKVNNLLTRWLPLSLFRENQSPQMKGKFKLASATTSELYYYKLETFFEDTDGDSLNYYYEVVHPGAELSWLKLEKSTGIFSGTPQVSDQGKTKLKLTVSDGYKEISTDLDLEVNFSALDLIIQFLTYGGFLLLVNPVFQYMYKCGKLLEGTYRNVKAGGGGAFFKWIKANQPFCQQDALTQLLAKVKNLRAKVAYHKEHPQIWFFEHHRKQESVRDEIEQFLKEMHRIQNRDSLMVEEGQSLSAKLAELEQEFRQTAPLLVPGGNVEPDGGDIQMVQQSA